MTLAALLDLGVPEEVIRTALDSLGLPGKLVVARVSKSGISATSIRVETPHEHKHRHLKHINEIIDRGALTDGAKHLARSMFLALAEAEAGVHNTTVEKVHFHEVGAVDSIFDFVGCAVGFDHLKIDRYTSRPVPTGTGTVPCEHGMMPVPAPATARLLQGMPLAHCDIDKELTTPTGAAILKTLVSAFGAPPDMTLIKVGTGAGSRDLPQQPNVLRLLLGETTEAEVSDGTWESDVIWQLETNLDDLSGEVIGYCTQRLMEAGALDVLTIPVQMKKQRPGTLLTLLCTEAQRSTLEALLFSETGTLGIRRHQCQRTKLKRESTMVDTPWGSIAGKKALLHGQWIFSPEFEACAQRARQHGVPLRDVYAAAHRAFAEQPTQSQKT
jgi:hypothetical protein